MGGGWAARLVLCIAAAACLCTVCAQDPVTLHRIVTSSQGCGPDRANSAEQCKQFAAAGVQCPGNVSNGTSTYQGIDTKSRVLGCACKDSAVYYFSNGSDETCGLSHPCICMFLPALDNCTQGTFFNTTINITIRCTINTVTTPPPSTIINVTLADCADTAEEQLIGQAVLWFLLGMLKLAILSKCTCAPKKREPTKGEPPTECSVDSKNGQHLTSAAEHPTVPSMPAYPAQHVLGGVGTSESMNLQAHQNCDMHGDIVYVQPLLAGWQEAIDTASGQTYYQNHLTHATQWIRPTAQNQGMVAGTNFGHLVVDVNGGAFGGMLPGILGMKNAGNQMLMHANSAMSTGPARPGPLDQTNDETQRLEVDATLLTKIKAFGMFMKDFGQRAAFIIPALIKGAPSFALYLYAIDFLLLAGFAYKGAYQNKARYCPGCLYNNLHIFIKGKELKPYFVSFKTKRFSATKKFIVGAGSLATIVNVVEGVTQIWCAWDAAGGSIDGMWRFMPKQDFLMICASAAGIFFAIPQSVVAVVGIFTFYGFATLLYIRVCLSFVLACCKCKAQVKLGMEKTAQENGTDQRGIMQRMGSIVSDRYSKENVNERRVSEAQAEVDSLKAKPGEKTCFGIPYPDAGSNTGTCMYKFWALIWESL